MSTKALLDAAMKLKPEERLTSGGGTDPELARAEESERRLKAYRKRRLEGIPMEEIFKEE